MEQLSLETVTKALIGAIQKVINKYKADSNVDENFCPGVIIGSNALMTIMGRIARALDVTIPSKLYIFSEKAGNKQLSIKEAAQKLISKAIQNEQ